MPWHTPPPPTPRALSSSRDPCPNAANPRVQIRERVGAAEERAGHPAFGGPNPEVGLEHHQKERHLRHAQGLQGLGHTGITGGFRGDGTPDVLPPNPHKHAREHAARPHGAGAAP